jgi:hypothetical protein
MSLNIFENQITGLLGHNGAGKVLFLNIFFTFTYAKFYFSLRLQLRLCFVVKTYIKYLTFIIVHEFIINICP